MDNVRVSSQFLFEVFRSCQEMGARKPVLLSALDLADADLRDPRNTFSAKAITALYQVTGQELERDNIFLGVGRRLIPTGFSDIGYGAMFEETVGDVLKAAAAAIESGFNGPLLRWEESASSCRLVVNPDCNIARDLVFIIFSALSHIGDSLLGGGLLGGGLRGGGARQGRADTGSGSGTDTGTGKNAANDYSHPVKSAFFKSRRPCNCEGFSLLSSGPALLFDQSETSLEWHRDVMNLPNPYANREVVRAVQIHSSRQLAGGNKADSLSRLSYTYLFPLLDRSGLSIDAAAETFGMAERTLRRKLAAEGASFRQILEQVRRNTCQLYFLEGTRSLSEIATKLGYSELSAFTRAYTAWHGHPPSQGKTAEIAVAA